MASLSVVGMDPSFRNWGVAAGKLDTDTMVLTIKTLRVIRGIELEGKQVRQTSSDLEVARQISEGVTPFQQADLTFAEVPSGSQSSRASLCSGICIGILGKVRASAPFFEVTPIEVKMAAVGKKTATKKQMIDWAVAKHPEAPWPRKSNGELLLGDAEHMADALAAIYAGIASLQFRQFLSMQKMQGSTP